MKKAYQKPVVRKVKLTPAEAVLAVGCKITMNASIASKRCREATCANSKQGTS